MPECHHGFTLMQTQGLRFPPQPHYLSKSPKKKLPPRSPCGAPASGKMLHHQSPLYMCLKVPRNETSPSRFPLQSPCIEKDAPSPGPSLYISQSPQSRALFTYLSKSPEKNLPPLPRFPLQSPYLEEDVPSPEPSLHIFKVPRKEAPPPHMVPSQSPTETDALFPEPSSVSCSPQWNSPAPCPPGSLSRPWWREMLITRAYCTYLSKFPIKEPPSKFPQGPTERDAHHRGLLHISFIKPSKGSPPSRFPSQSPHREGCFISKTHLYLSLKGPGREPPTWFPNGAPQKEVPFPRAFIHQLTHLRGKNLVYQAGPPCLVRLQYKWEVVWYSRGRRLWQTHPLPFIP
jgi:hypothetical protein